MAKKQHQEPEPPAASGSDAPGSAPAPALSTPREGLWYVRCDCPTPLPVREAVVAATGPADALRVYLAANGISGSDHPIEIVHAGDTVPPSVARLE